MVRYEIGQQVRLVHDTRWGRYGIPTREFDGTHVVLSVHSNGGYSVDVLDPADRAECNYWVVKEEMLTPAGGPW